MRVFVAVTSVHRIFLLLLMAGMAVCSQAADLAAVIAVRDMPEMRETLASSLSDESAQIGFAFLMDVVSNLTDVTGLVETMQSGVFFVDARGDATGYVWMPEARAQEVAENHPQGVFQAGDCLVLASDGALTQDKKDRVGEVQRTWMAPERDADVEVVAYPAVFLRVRTDRMRTALSEAEAGHPANSDAERLRRASAGGMDCFPLKQRA